jgi:hypothetical protein
LDFISSAKLLVIDANSIHISAVETAHILDAPTLGSVTELGVMPTDRNVVEENFAFLSPADNNNLTAFGQRILGSLTWTSVHDEHR